MTRSPSRSHPCRSEGEPVRRANSGPTGYNGVRAHTGLTSRPLHEGSITRSRREGPRKHPPARTTRSHALRVRERSCRHMTRPAMRSRFAWSGYACQVRASALSRPVQGRPRSLALPRTKTSSTGLAARPKVITSARGALHRTVPMTDRATASSNVLPLVTGLLLRGAAWHRAVATKVRQPSQGHTLLHRQRRQRGREPEANVARRAVSQRLGPGVGSSGSGHSWGGMGGWPCWSRWASSVPHGVQMGMVRCVVVRERAGGPVMGPWQRGQWCTSGVLGVFSRGGEDFRPGGV